MTDIDLMPFGKHKGVPMGQVPKSYLDWLVKQEGFAEKNPAMAKYIRGDADAASPKELENIKVAETILAKAPESFKHWWNIAYGDRLRKQGEIHYIGYLRVALEAWLHCEGIFVAGPKTPPPSTITTPSKPQPFISPKPKPATADVTDEF